MNLADHIQGGSYLRERLQPRPGDSSYLHLSDLRLAMETVRTSLPIHLLDYGCGGSPYRTLFPNSSYKRADYLQKEGDRLDYVLDKDSGVNEKDGTFDFILSTQVLEHVGNPQDYLKECHRLLKAGGKLYLTTHGTYPDHGCPYDFYRWTAEGLFQELQAVGFKICRMEKQTTGPRAFFMQCDNQYTSLIAPRRTLFGLLLYAFRMLYPRLRPWASPDVRLVLLRKSSGADAIGKSRYLCRGGVSYAENVAMPRIYLTSYATERFASVQRDLNVSAIQWGVSNLLTYREGDLKASDYYRRNRSILDEVCGAGYWAWKPYFILQALEHLNEDDVLFYCDAGSMFVDSPQPLIQLCSSHPQGMILFDAQPLTNRQFTKRDCFVRLNCDEQVFWDARKVIATLLVMRKTGSTMAFLQEWLTFCQDRAAITDDANICGLPDLPGFLQHRWDQAILSVLAAKHKMETFRNPTVWGNFLKLPPFRVPGEQIVSPYYLPPEIKTYAPRSQENSPYGTLFVINRLPNYVGKKPFASPAAKTGKSLMQKAASRLRSLKTAIRKKPDAKSD